MTGLCRLSIWRDDEEIVLHVPAGANLREVLLDHDLSPYARFTEGLNCGGRGLCATCGVWVDEGPEAVQWHDRLAQRFGYPRLACQITIERDTAVRLATDKLIWRGRCPVPLGPQLMIGHE
jgi:ferredoxin